MLLEVGKLLLDALLLLLHSRIGGAVLRERLAEHVRGLVYLALVHVLREVVVHRHRSSVVEVACHDGLLREERSKVVVLHPEERIACGSVAEVVFALQDRAERQHLRVERRVAVVEVRSLLHVVGCHFARRNVAVVDTYAAVGALVEDVVVVEQRLEVHLRCVVEHLIAVQTIFVGGDRTLHHELEDIREEVHLRTYRLHRIVESGVGVLSEVYLAVYVASPCHVLVHRFLRWERYLGAHAQSLVFLLLLLSLLAAACRRLCRSYIGTEEGGEEYC